MRKMVHCMVLVLLSGAASAQGIEGKLAAAVKILEADSQMKNAIVGMCVASQRGGGVLYSRNDQVGLAVASSQKVITSAASLELLGTDYRFTTDLSYDGKLSNGIINGNLQLSGSGDPTLGSWRYERCKEREMLNKWIKAIRQAGIKEVQGTVTTDTRGWETQTIPGGWIWDDIGNYYGAGASGLNWRENQYDINLASGNKTGDEVSVVSILPKLYNASLANELTTGKPGSGDNAYIYLPPYSNSGFMRGTIPPGEHSFTISGSFPNPPFQLASVVTAELQKQGIKIDSANAESAASAITDRVILYRHLSPSLDSINNWFLKKSINLYGEALVKTLGYEKSRQGSTEAGLKVVNDFWESQGIEPTELAMVDGSGLSPQNRITAAALVSVMQYARLRPWFTSFYNALPEINGLKMKSGIIGGVRSFTGYAGAFTFAIIVNNFNGSPGDIVKKMYKVLDVLK